MRLPGWRRRLRLPSGWGSSWCRRSRCRACTSTPKTCMCAGTGSTWRRSRRPASGPSRSGSTGPGRSSRSCAARASTCTLEDAVREAGDALSIGRPHIARAAGASGDLGPFFEEYLVPGAKAFVARRWPTAEQAIEIIHEAGGVAVIAHPYWDISEPTEVEDLIRSARRRRRRDLLPDPLQGADGTPPGPLRRAEPGPNGIIGLPRPDPQDLLEVRRLRHLRPRQPPGPPQAVTQVPQPFRCAFSGS